PAVRPGPGPEPARRRAGPEHVRPARRHPDPPAHRPGPGHRARLVARRRRRRARPGRELRAAVKRAARTRAQGTRGRAGRCRARLRGQAPCASGARAARRPPSVAVASALAAGRHSAPEPPRAAHRLKCPPVSASRLPLVTVIAAVLAGGALAQDFPFLPESRHDPAIPTFAAVIGRPLGEEPSTHAEAERYLQALARASDR